MGIYRVQMAFPMDGTLPRDVITINPHYNAPDAGALAEGLKANLIANANIGAVTPFTLNVYDAKKAPPSYPLASASQVGTAPANTSPREVALCLSYYAQFNRPTLRGRLFLPYIFIGGGLGLRPTASQRSNAALWVTTLGKNLPPGSFWTVFSRKMGTDAQVTNYWIDDEWDTVRSRGLRGTTRTMGTLP